MMSLANPSRFVGATRFLILPLGVLTLVVFIVGLVFAFLAPPDYQQGAAVRIMFVHVPSAWMAMFCYGLLAGLSFIRLIWGHRLCDIAALSCAKLGACFTFLALFTGALWGKPIWGAFWVWDGRLTSVLVLFFIYMGYLALRGALEGRENGAKLAAYFALIGAINLPIIKFSVVWWNTLHQGASIAKFSAPSIHVSLLVPLLIMAGGFVLFFFHVLLLEVHAEVYRRQSKKGGA